MKSDKEIYCHRNNKSILVLLAEIGGFYAILGIIIAVLGNSVAKNEFLKSVNDGSPVEIAEEIHDHNLCRSIKENSTFEVSQGEIDRIDRIL